MKGHTIFLHVAMIVLLLSAPAAVAGDFDWLNDFNVTAEADASGFRARLSTRFPVGDATMNAVMVHVERPADAYMVLRLGEIAKRPPEEVLKKYKASKGKGWGVLAKSLGIKPGSREFHALKSGHDLDGGGGGKRNVQEGKERGKGKGRP